MNCYLQRKIGPMLVSLVIGPVKGPCQIFRANEKHLSEGVIQRGEVSAREITTTSPKPGATASIDADPLMNRATARSETLVTGNGKDLSHLLSRAGHPPETWRDQERRTVLGIVKTLLLGARVGHRTDQGLRDASFKSDRRSIGHQRHRRWIISGEPR